jgi:hypothetical protein
MSTDFTKINKKNEHTTILGLESVYYVFNDVVRKMIYIYMKISQIKYITYQ